MKSTPRTKNSEKKLIFTQSNSSRSSRPITPNSMKSEDSDKFWTKKELVNYYTLKVAEYESEVEKQIQLLKKRKALLQETKNVKTQLFNLIEKRDSLSKEASQIEQQIALLENHE
ncbi:hypothetical protein M9Y10_015149 [Tritrichomonas musculus]|uniref:Uncharacterized protein n=1 Tax=Tritrichomonas musculus TaxID=1915356 RepID=A0ABR2L1L1_9EUKA